MKVDIKKEMKYIYSASSKKVEEVEVPKMNFIMIDGEGNPNETPWFGEAVSALFSTAYTIKFMIKKAEGIDYSVMPLEGLWWMDDMNEFTVENKHRWKWTLMIMQPEYVTREIYENGLEAAKKKKGIKALDNLRFESYEEGLSAQLLHIGPYTEEEQDIEAIHKYIEENGYDKTGKHHEIYLSDMTKTAPEKLKTILRQPMKKK
ncbi:MAG: GyrI-like domain-containing protein [Bacillota bacterium]